MPATGTSFAGSVPDVDDIDPVCDNQRRRDRHEKPSVPECSGKKAAKAKPQSVKHHPKKEKRHNPDANDGHKRLAAERSAQFALEKMRNRPCPSARKAWVSGDMVEDAHTKSKQVRARNGNDQQKDEHRQRHPSS